MTHALETRMGVLPSRYPTDNTRGGPAQLSEDFNGPCGLPRTYNMRGHDRTGFFDR